MQFLFIAVHFLHLFLRCVSYKKKRKLEIQRIYLANFHADYIYMIRLKYRSVINRLRGIEA